MGQTFSDLFCSLPFLFLLFPSIVYLRAHIKMEISFLYPYMTHFLIRLLQNCNFYIPEWNPQIQRLQDQFFLYLFKTLHSFSKLFYSLPLSIPPSTDILFITIVFYLVKTQPYHMYAKTHCPTNHQLISRSPHSTVFSQFRKPFKIAFCLNQLT